MSLETPSTRGLEKSYETEQKADVKLSPFYVNEVGETLDVREHTVYEIGDLKLSTLAELYAQTYAQTIEEFDNADKDAAKNLANQVREKYRN